MNQWWTWCATSEVVADGEDDPCKAPRASEVSCSSCDAPSESGGRTSVSSPPTLDVAAEDRAPSRVSTPLRLGPSGIKPVSPGADSMPNVATLLSATQLAQLSRRVLPLCAQGQWRKVLCISGGNASMAKFQHAVHSVEGEVLVIVQAAHGARFGGLLCPDKDQQSFGERWTRDSCLWELAEDDRDFTVHRWAGGSHAIAHSAQGHWSMGYEPAFGLRLDGSLDRGASSPCATFGNVRPLGGIEAFVVDTVEVLVFCSSASVLAGMSLSPQTQLNKTPPRTPTGEAVRKRCMST
jgi:hypothetical protein